MEKHEKFLNFNGKNIHFLSINGTYWVALKPICEALGIDARRARELAKKDGILGSVVSTQALVIPVFRKDIGSVNQSKNMTCLPEKYIYGWLFSIKSKSKELIEYKKTCYDLLYNHFHGTITNRKEILVERLDVDYDIRNLRDKLKEQDEEYIQLGELLVKRKMLSQQLNTIDKELVKQPELFEGEN